MEGKYFYFYFVISRDISEFVILINYDKKING